jgi:hypothetical protein
MWGGARRTGRILVGVFAGTLVMIAAAEAGPPFLTDDPEPVDYQHWEVYGFSTGMKAEGDTSGMGPSTEVNYGAAPDLQLHLIAGGAYDASSGGGPRWGFGDSELGVKYRFLDLDGKGGIDAGIFPQIVLPTGDAQRGLGTGHTQEFLPLWLQKTFGQWTSDAGGGYWNHPGAGNKNYWFIGWLLQYQLTDRLAVGGELFHQTADTDTAEDYSGFNLGAVYDFSNRYHLLVSAGRGIENVQEDELSYYIAFQLTF